MNVHLPHVRIVVHVWMELMDMIAAANKAIVELTVR